MNLAAAWSWLALVAPPGPAPTVVIPLSFTEIVRQSELIAIGTATASECRYAEGRQTIRTFVTFGDVEVHRGQLAGPLVLQLEGGTIGVDHLQVPDLPRFTLGRRYLMFIAGNGKRWSPIVGFHQGLFELALANGRQVLRNHRGVELIGVVGDRFVFAGPAAAPKAPVVPALVPALAPALAAGESRSVPAAANVLEVEAQLQRARQQPPPPPALQEVTPPQRREPAAVGEPPPPWVASRPGAAPQPDKSPIVVPPDQDRGDRLAAVGLLAEAARVR